MTGLADGGARTTYQGGGLREPSQGKGRYDLLPTYPLYRDAKHFEAGAAKYADRNWEQGLPLDRFIESAFRHLCQFMLGDRVEDHLAAIRWNIGNYMDQEHRMECEKGNGLKQFAGHFYRLGGPSVAPDRCTDPVPVSPAGPVPAPEARSMEVTPSLDWDKKEGT
jgi:hypothetical protein